jgi:Acetyltransferases, including N-acetylases of ribosomal proteins
MITGKHIRLRALEREDIPSCVRWMNDPDVVRYISTCNPLSMAMEEKWFEKQLQQSQMESQILAIETHVGLEWIHIGNTSLNNFQPVTRSAEFGIMIGNKEFWHKGLGQETAKLMLKHGFEDLNLNRICLYVFAENLRAIHTYESVGYVKEGVLRQAIYKNGLYNDFVVMSVLHSEWKGFTS